MNRWLYGLVASALMSIALASESSAPGDSLRYLLTHDCGSCHGMQLKGGLGPPLTREALKGYPVDYVAQVILDGRTGTAMPPWRALLTSDDARWLAEQLIKGME
ncbi:MAG: hypothetical protein DHS20C01_09630 [marine bacterium B5-7]|nr:MAG: hypothetical protein DHS20C01_09630 [marine bacterium B5-7]